MKNHYNTKQQNILIGFLEHNSDRTFSIKEITDSICSSERVGKSTIYRLVSKLVKDGTLQRMYGTDGKSVLYRYVADSRHCSSHFHLKCENCGRFVHLECDIFSNVQQHIKSHHGFDINSNKTVIYGMCSSCSVKG